MPNNKIEGISAETADIPIPVRAYLGPIILEIPAKPAQVAVVVRMATQELLAAGIISPRVPASDAERAIVAAQQAARPSAQRQEREETTDDVARMRREREEDRLRDLDRRP